MAPISFSGGRTFSAEELTLLVCWETKAEAVARERTTTREVYIMMPMDMYLRSYYPTDRG